MSATEATGYIAGVGLGATRPLFHSLKNTTVLAAVVIGLSLIISASILGSAIEAYGRSLEKAAISQAPSPIPSRFAVDLETGGNPVQVEVNSKR